MKNKIKNTTVSNPKIKLPEILDKNGNPYPIPKEGSLGLLALGHVGVLAWRAKRRKAGI